MGYALDRMALHVLDVLSSTPEIFELIAAVWDVGQIGRVSCICRRFEQLCHDPRLWELRCQMLFGVQFTRAVQQAYKAPYHTVFRRLYTLDSLHWTELELDDPVEARSASFAASVTMGQDGDLGNVNRFCFGGGVASAHQGETVYAAEPGTGYKCLSDIRMLLFDPVERVITDSCQRIIPAHARKCITPWGGSCVSVRD